MEYTHKFVKNTKYYTGKVWEWNLPAGWACPFAKECLVKVDPETGKFDNKSNAFRCYAANAERFPGVRKMRWTNFEYVKKGNRPVITGKMKAVRVHASGDFFSQKYFDMWMDIAKEHPDVEFWAFTKSIPYWVDYLERNGKIPDNFMLTASYGGKHDELIKKHNLKYTKVFYPDEIKVDGYKDGYLWVYVPDDGYSKPWPVDINDDWARISIVDSKDVNFVLIENRHLKELMNKYGKGN